MLDPIQHINVFRSITLLHVMIQFRVALPGTSGACGKRWNNKKSYTYVSHVCCYNVLCGHFFGPLMFHFHVSSPSKALIRSADSLPFL